MYLSSNESLPWSESLIERYKDKWNWRYLSRNESLPWSEALIECHSNNWNWEKLSDNKSVIKLFRNWTKQEISTALERIRSAQNDGSSEEYPDGLRGIDYLEDDLDLPNFIEYDLPNFIED
jgi:hypothetical protein